MQLPKLLRCRLSHTSTILTRMVPPSNYGIRMPADRRIHEHLIIGFKIHPSANDAAECSKLSTEGLASPVKTLSHYLLQATFTLAEWDSMACGLLVR